MKNQHTPQGSTGNDESRGSSFVAIGLLALCVGGPVAIFAPILRGIKNDEKERVKSYRLLREAIDSFANSDNNSLWSAQEQQAFLDHFGVNYTLGSEESLMTRGFVWDHQVYAKHQLKPDPVRIGMITYDQLRENQASDLAKSNQRVKDYQEAGMKR